MASALPATAVDDAARGGQLLIDACRRPSVPVMDSKPSRVPLPASRPMQDDLCAASPPTSLPVGDLAGEDLRDRVLDGEVLD